MSEPGGAFYFVSLNKKTIFFKLQDIFPECFVHRERVPNVDPMLCLQGECPVNHNCMETLAKRIFVLFKEILPAAQLIVLYYKKRIVEGMGGSLFWRDMREPRNISINPWGWESAKKRSLIYKFEPGPYFYLTGSAPPPEEISDESVKMP
jgi:hypothetical protein